MASASEHLSEILNERLKNAMVRREKAEREIGEIEELFKEVEHRQERQKAGMPRGSTATIPDHEME